MIETDPDKEMIIDNSYKDKLLTIDPRTTNLRFYMLFLACLLCFGSYFAYDIPAALETQLEEVIIYLANEPINSRVQFILFNIFIP